MALGIYGRMAFVGSGCCYAITIGLVFNGMEDMAVRTWLLGMAIATLMLLET
jgi:hypothetical protein